jgi:hypothetical protein
MTLFELEALLKLDTSAFDTGVTTAKGEADDLAEKLNGISVPGSIDDEIAALDSQIAALDAEINDLDNEMRSLQLDIDIDDLDDEREELESDIRQLESSGAALQGISEGIADAISEVAQATFKALAGFAKDAFDEAAESGSSLAKEYQRNLSSLNITTNMLKDNLGNRLLAIGEWITGGVANVADWIAENVTGYDDYEKMLSAIELRSQYEAQFVEDVKAALSRSVDTDSAPFEADEEYYKNMMDLYDRQIQYMEDYESVIAELRSKGVDESVIAKYASGSSEDYQALLNLNALTEEQLATLIQREQEVDKLREETAQSLTRTSLAETDPTYQRLQEEVVKYAQLAIESGSMTMSTQDVTINAANPVKELGGGGRRVGAMSETYGPELPPGWVIDDTAQNNEQKLNSAIASLSAAIDGLPSVISGALAGASVTMDGTTVGNIVFPQISERLSRAVRMLVAGQ